MWQYNFTYLCHADQRKDHKYIDRYKDRRGNWQYLYPEDIKKANSPYRSQRYSNVNEAQNAREAAIAKGAATAQRPHNRLHYTYQNREAAEAAAEKKSLYEGSKRAGEEAAAKEAAGKTLGEHIKSVLYDEKRDNEVPSKSYRIESSRDIKNGVEYERQKTRIEGAKDYDFTIQRLIKSGIIKG